MPLETLNAYATIAADGKYCKPIPVVDIYEANGTKLANVSEPQCKQAVKPEIARAAIDAARCPVYDQGFFGGCDGGTARDVDSRTVRDVVGRPIAGKTGTSDFNWTANLFLTNKQLAVGGTLANPDFAQTEHDGTAARKVNTAVSRTMRDALKGLPRVNFTAPPRTLAFGVRVRVPDVKCTSVRAATSAMRTRGFDVSVDPRRVDSECAAGEVAGTDPTGTTSRGSTIVLLISNGTKPNPSPTPWARRRGWRGPRRRRWPGGGGPGGGNGLGTCLRFSATPVGACEGSSRSAELAADLGGDTATLGSPGDGRLRRLHGRTHLGHAAEPAADERAGD